MTATQSKPLTEAGVIEATIPATKSNPERKVRYIPTCDGQHDARVVVTERRGVNVVRLVSSTYLVEEVPAFGFDGRQWLVCKDKTNGADLDTVRGQANAERCGNVYEVTVFSDRVHGGCTCDGMTASKGKNLCVHFLAMRELMGKGVPNPLANAEADFGPTEFDEPADWRVGPKDASGRPAYVIPPDEMP